MKTLACVGCSWTRGHGVQSNETYPYFLQNYLSNFNTINAGIEGISIELYPAIINWVEKNHDPDFYLIQITTPDRLIWGTDNTQNVKKTHYKTIDFCHTNETVKRLWIKEDIRFSCFTVGDGISAFCKKNLGHIHSHYEKCFKNPYSQTKVGEVINLLKVWYSTYMNSSVAVYNYVNYIFLIQSQLEALNKPFKLFYYTPDKSASLECAFDIGSLLKPNNFLYNATGQNKTASFEEFLKNTYNDKWEQFFIDSGYHLSPQGNEIFAKDYIIPELDF